MKAIKGEYEIEFEVRIVGYQYPTLKLNPIWSSSGGIRHGVVLQSGFSPYGNYFGGVINWHDAVLIGLVTLAYVPINLIRIAISIVESWFISKNPPLGKWSWYGGLTWMYRTSDFISMISRYEGQWRAQSMNCKKDDYKYGYRIDSSWHKTRKEAMRHCEGLKVE